MFGLGFDSDSVVRRAINETSARVGAIALLLMEKGVFTQVEWESAIARMTTFQDQQIAEMNNEYRKSPEGQTMAFAEKLFGIKPEGSE